MWIGVAVGTRRMLVEAKFYVTDFGRFGGLAGLG